MYWYWYNRIVSLPPDCLWGWGEVMPKMTSMVIFYVLGELCLFILLCVVLPVFIMTKSVTRCF